MVQDIRLPVTWEAWVLRPPVTHLSMEEEVMERQEVPRPPWAVALPMAVEEVPSRLKELDEARRN